MSGIAIHHHLVEGEEKTVCKHEEVCAGEERLLCPGISILDSGALFSVVF